MTLLLGQSSGPALNQTLWAGFQPLLYTHFSYCYGYLTPSNTWIQINIISFAKTTIIDKGKLKWQ